MNSDSLLAVLPRTECGQCGYSGCRPYALALCAGEAAPDLCAPGGPYVRSEIKALLDIPGEPAFQVILAPMPVPAIARIDEEVCIGCVKCLDACPVDAIIGAAHQLHGVLEEACTGCGLCIPPCPVDCIVLVPGAIPKDGWPHGETAAARVIRATDAEACTACGNCVPACPEALHPQALYSAIQDLDFATASSAGLSRCTECAACDAVCPSHIPLSAYFSQSRLFDAAFEQARHAAEQATTRHAARTRRLAGASVIARTSVLPELKSITGLLAAQEIADAVRRARVVTPLDSSKV